MADYQDSQEFTCCTVLDLGTTCIAIAMASCRYVLYVCEQGEFSPLKWEGHWRSRGE